MRIPRQVGKKHESKTNSYLLISLFLVPLRHIYFYTNIHEKSSRLCTDLIFLFLKNKIALTKIMGPTSIYMGLRRESDNRTIYSLYFLVSQKRALFSDQTSVLRSTLSVFTISSSRIGITVMNNLLALGKEDQCPCLD